MQKRLEKGIKFYLWLDDMKCCFYEALIKKGETFLSTRRYVSVRLRLFQNWNSQCCKCQAFITHNLFISLHIKLANVFLCAMWEWSGMHVDDDDEWLHKLALFTCAQLRFPAVIHEVLRADIVIVCALVEFPMKKEDEKRIV